MSSITINGKNSYADFGALLTSRSTPPPSIRDISATIPYRNGDICFTYQNGGKPTYDTRTLTYKFVFMDCPKTALRKAVADFENWILSAGECDLYDDAEIYHYKARAISCTESEKGYHVEVTATFKAQPYKLSDDFSDKGFDDFSFEIKFHGFGWRGNEVRYLFLLASIVLIIILRTYAIPVIIVLYIVVSAVRWLCMRSGNPDKAPKA